MFLGVDGSFLSYNLFTYCQNNPVITSDPSGEFGLVDDLVALAIVAIPFIPILVLSATPPLVLQKTVIKGLNNLFNDFSYAVEQGAVLLEAKTKGKERMRDSGLAEESDEEISRKARDKKLPKSERERYKGEEKARGIRNRRKRNELY